MPASSAFWPIAATWLSVAVIFSRTVCQCDVHQKGHRPLHGWILRHIVKHGGFRNRLDVFNHATDVQRRSLRPPCAALRLAFFPPCLTTFDGNGGLTQEDFVLGNGVLGPGPTDPETGFHNMESGTYKVNANCTGTFTVNFPTPPGDTTGAVIVTMFVLTNHGRTIHTIVSSLTPPDATEPVPASIHSDGERQ